MNNLIPANKILADDPVIKSIPIRKFVAYLERNAWTQTHYPNDKLIKFEGPNTSEGEKIELFLPKSHSLADSNSYLAEAINLLGIVEQEPINSIIRRIKAEEGEEGEETGTTNNNLNISRPLTIWEFLKPLLKDSIFLIFFAAIVLIISGIALITYFNQLEVKRNLRQTRIAKMSDVLSKLTLYEDLSKSIVDGLEQIKISNPRTTVTMSSDEDTLKELNELMAKNIKLQQSLSTTIDENKFWLGDDVHRRIKNYADATFDYYVNLKANKVSDQEKAERINEKTYIDELGQKVLNGQL